MVMHEEPYLDTNGIWHEITEHEAVFNMEELDAVRMLAEAMEADLPYEIRCPALLICGEKDYAGSTMRYNRAWHRETGIPIEWISGAGHNSNTDAPETVNALIQRFVDALRNNKRGDHT